jgi:hypothetical protein
MSKELDVKHHRHMIKLHRAAVSEHRTEAAEHEEGSPLHKVHTMEADHHQEVVDHHEEMLEACQKSMETSDLNKLVPDNVRSVIPPSEAYGSAAVLTAVPRTGAPELNEKPNVPVELQHFVKITDD